MSAEIKNHENENNAEISSNSRQFDGRIEVPGEVDKPEGKDIKTNEVRTPDIQNNETKQETEHRYDGLSDAEKSKLKQETGWSDKIVDFIRSPEEANIYKDAGLKETEIGGRTCLVRSDIDWNAKDEDGLTNRERAEEGKAPLVDDKPVELHHIGQKEDSPLAELSQDEHHNKDNFTVLHDNSHKSEVGHGAEFAKTRQEHWQARSEAGGKQNDTDY